MDYKCTGLQSSVQLYSLYTMLKHNVVGGDNVREGYCPAGILSTHQNESKLTNLAASSKGGKIQHKAFPSVQFGSGK